MVCNGKDVMKMTDKNYISFHGDEISMIFRINDLTESYDDHW